MKNKIVALLSLVILTSLLFCGCSSSSNNNGQSQSGTTLTEEQIQEIKEELPNKIEANLLYEVNRLAETRESAGKNSQGGQVKDWADGITFYKYDTETIEQDAQSPDSVCAYGKLYGKTKFGDAVTSTFTVRVKCDNGTYDYTYSAGMEVNR